jgi:uncharacterized membrane protein YqjE
MVNQTKVTPDNGSQEADPSTISQDVGELTDGLINLVELQAQLFSVDMRECSRKSRIPLGFVLIGLGIGGACFPIMLIAVALMLVQDFDFSYAAAFAMTAGGGAIASALMCTIGWIRIRKHAAILQRSRRELVRNFSWIKKVVAHERTTRHNGFDNNWRTVR